MLKKLGLKNIIGICVNPSANAAHLLNGSGSGNFLKVEFLVVLVLIILALVLILGLILGIEAFPTLETEVLLVVGSLMGMVEVLIPRILGFPATMKKRLCVKCATSLVIQLIGAITDVIQVIKCLGLTTMVRILVLLVSEISLRTQLSFRIRVQNHSHKLYSPHLRISVIPIGTQSQELQTMLLLMLKI